MSGGSYDYVYRMIEDAALQVSNRHPGSGPHIAFAKLLLRAAKAMKAIEWEDSGDTDSDSTLAAIAKVVTPELELEAAISIANDAAVMLSNALVRADLASMSRNKGEE